MDYSSIPVVDIVFFVLLLFGAFTGFRHGLSGELARIVTTLLALGAGVYFFRQAGGLLEERTFLEGTAADAGAFAIIVIAALLILWLVRLVIQTLVEFTFKSPVQEIGGGIVGLLRTAVVLGLAVLVVSLTGIESLQHHVIDTSSIGRGLERIVRPLYDDFRAGEEDDLGPVDEEDVVRGG